MHHIDINGITEEKVKDNFQKQRPLK